MEQRDYLKEAFELLRPVRLREAEEFDLSSKNYTGDIEDFMGADDVDVDAVDDGMSDVVDLGAADETELSQDYAGNFIIECKCCHLRLFKPEEELTPNEDQTAVNEGEECPQCGNIEGYFVIGKVEAATAGDIAPEEDEEEDIIDVDDVTDADDDASMAQLDGEVEEPEEEVEESVAMDKVNKFLGKNAKKDVKESLDEAKGGALAKMQAFLGESADEKCEDGECDKKLEKMDEAINNIQIDGDDESFTLDKGDDGSVSINIAPTNGFEGGEGELTAEPLSDEDMASIEAIEPEDEEAAEAEFEEPVEGEEEFEEVPEEGGEEEVPAEGEEVPGEETEEEEEFNGFAAESFQAMAGKYITETYHNTKAFKVTGVADVKGRGLVVEGKIYYKSGAKPAKTQFVFTEARETSKGKLVLEGYNQTFTTAKAFKVLGEMKDHNYTPEMFKYNYKVTKNLNESLAKPVLVEGIYTIKK